ncbi:MAG TPA: hypothetical protein VFD94_10420, partial [Jatrophihabitans sp.]|nr:hypothetical protein [Jatrophihabitans sp.]
MQIQQQPKLPGQELLEFRAEPLEEFRAVPDRLAEGGIRRWHGCGHYAGGYATFGQGLLRDGPTDLLLRVLPAQDPG